MGKTLVHVRSNKVLTSIETLSLTNNVLYSFVKHIIRSKSRVY